MRWSPTPPRRRGRRTALFAVLASVVAVGAVACTDDNPGAATAPRTTVELAWTAPMDPVSGVTMAGDTAVVYAITPDGLTLNGLDPATGAVRWTQAAAPLADAEGLSVGVLDDSRAVAYYRPDGRARQARLVIADATTGTDRVTTEPRWWSGWPTQCDDEVGAVCATTSTQSDEGFWRDRPVRIDIATAAITAVRDAAAQGVELLAVDSAIGLYIRRPDTVDGTGQLARWSAEEENWQRPLPDIFGALITQAADWTSAPGPDPDTRVVSVRSLPLDDNTIDLDGDWSTSLVDLRDGSTRWTVPGSTLRCGGISITSPSNGDLLMCRARGTATEEQDDRRAKVTRTSGLSVTVERVDESTGTPRWSAEIGDAPDLVAGTNPDRGVAHLDDDRVLLLAATGPRVLDLDTGAVREPAPQEEFWCDARDSYRLPQPRYWVSSPVTVAARWGVHQRCAADGTASPTGSVPTTVPRDVSNALAGDTLAEQVLLVSEVDGVRAYRVPPRSDAAVGVETPPTIPPSSNASAASTPNDEPAAPGVPWPTEVREAWSFSDIRPVSPVAMVGETAVFYGLLQSDLYLVGLDPQTGAERWRRETTTAGLSNGSVLAVQQINQKVIALLPSSGPNRSLVSVPVALIDPADGRDVVISETRRWRTSPGPCGEDQSKICATALIGAVGQNGTEALTVDPVTGSVGPAPEPAENFEPLWNTLVTVKNEPVATLGRRDGDQLAWARPFGDIMGAPITFEHMTDYGRAMDIFLMSTEGEEGDADDSPTDLATSLRSAGFAAADGTTKWQEQGTSNSCRGTLHPPGSVSLPGSEFGQLRCRYTGILTTDPTRGISSTSGDLTVNLERFDAQNGNTLWSIALGNTPALLSRDHGRIPLLDDTRIVVSQQVIDLDVGTTRPADLSDIFWCPGPTTFDQSVPYNASDTGTSMRTDRRTHGLAELCSSRGASLTAVSGSTAPAIPTAVPLAYSTPTASGLRIVSFEDRVVAYEVPR